MDEDGRAGEREGGSNVKGGIGCSYFIRWKTIFNLVTGQEIKFYLFGGCTSRVIEKEMTRH